MKATEPSKETTETKYAEDDSCAHPVVLQDAGVCLCMDCGMEVSQKVTYERDWRFNSNTTGSKQTADANRFYIRKVSERSIHSDIQHIEISEHIKDVANTIYNSIADDKVHRGTFRKSVIFATVFYAFKSVHNPQSCDNLIQLFKIKRKNALKGIKYVNMHLPGKSTLRTSYITAQDLVCDFMKRFDCVPQQVDEVLAMCATVQKHASDMLSRSRPQSVAAGVLYHYCMTRRRPVNSKEFSSLVGVSEMTILKIARDCAIILRNSPAEPAH